MVRIRLFLIVVIASLISSLATPIYSQPTEFQPIAEKSPLLKEPTTPEGMFSATLLMIDLARMDLAVHYMHQFEVSSPDDEVLLKLRDKFGMADFLKLARTKELQPQSTELLDRMINLAKKQVEDPAFVTQLIRRLIDVPAQHHATLAELRNAGIDVVPELIRQMSLDEFANDQDTLAIALGKMGKQVSPAVIAALDSPVDRIRIAMIGVLGMLKSTEAVPYLWFPAFDESQPAGVRDAAKTCLARLLNTPAESTDKLSSVDAANELRRLAKLYYRKPDLQAADENGQVSLWVWNDEAGTVQRQTMPVNIGAMLMSSRFARQALALSPDQPEAQRQYLAVLLGLEVLRSGWGHSRPAGPGTAMYLARTAGEATVSDVLKEALEAGQAATAVAALDVLGQIGSREQLTSKSGIRSPVQAALNSPDQRIQFAAATTIMKLEPKTGFYGVHRIVEILSRATVDPGRPRAIVIDADQQRASITAGYFSEAGYDVVIAATSREGFEQAAASSGVEVVLVHVNCQQWNLTQTLANLRADARTATIPIAVYGPGSLEKSLMREVTRSSPAAYILESASASDFVEQLTPFLKMVRTPPLSAEERTAQKSAAIYWLAMIGNRNQTKLFDLKPAQKELLDVTDDPSVARNALVALAYIGSRPVQQRLSDVALNSLANDTLREVAADQLAIHIHRFGLLLNRDEIEALHTGWKAAENPNIKSALASVIGVLKPNGSIVGERLQQFPLPPSN